MSEAKLIRVYRAHWSKIVRSVMVEFTFDGKFFVGWFPFDGQYPRLSDDPYFYRGKNVYQAKECIMPAGFGLSILEAAARKELDRPGPATKARK